MCSMLRFCLDLITRFRSVSNKSQTRKMSPIIRPFLGTYTTSYNASKFSCWQFFIIMISRSTLLASTLKFNWKDNSYHIFNMCQTFNRNLLSCLNIVGADHRAKCPFTNHFNWLVLKRQVKNHSLVRKPIHS